MHTELTENQQAYIAESIIEFLKLEQIEITSYLAAQAKQSDDLVAKVEDAILVKKAIEKLNEEEKENV